MCVRHDAFISNSTFYINIIFDNLNEDKTTESLCVIEFLLLTI